MKKKSVIINAVIATVITALTVYYLVKTDVITKDGLSAISWYSVPVCLFYFFFSFAVLSVVDYLIYRTFTNDMTYLKCFKNTLSGHLGSSVTPYRVGHFPLMAYYQARDKIKLSDTATGLVKCQIIYSITSIAVYSAVVITLAITGTSVVVSGNTVALWSVITLGLLFHIGAFMLTFILAFSPTLQKAALKFSAVVIKKIKKSFDKEKYISEKSEKLRVFRSQVSVIGKKFYYYLIPAGIYCLYNFISGMMPYLCYLVISGEVFMLGNFLTFYVLTLSSAYITNIIPIPSGAGAAEIIFKTVFETVIPSVLLGSVLLLWRASTFYFAVIIEIIWFIVFSVIKSNKKIMKKDNDKN